MLAELWREKMARRFRLPAAPTLLSAVGGVSPISITRLTCEHPDHGRTEAPAVEDAYSVQISLVPMPSAELVLHGRQHVMPSTPPGGIFLFNLESHPVAIFHSPFDFVRFGISQAALDELARSGDAPPPAGLSRPPFAAYDAILQQLALAAVPALARPHEASTLFVDELVLAFHAHLVGAYAGRSRDVNAPGRGLAPWQARMATELIEARLDGHLSIVELAAECRLSAKHFSRAFRQTFSMPPCRWLNERRVDRARHMLTMGNLALATIATECGFGSQSHFNRVFSSLAGVPPGAWRRFMLRKSSVYMSMD
jgi:AraC family transcriptional regulator